MAYLLHGKQKGGCGKEGCNRGSICGDANKNGIPDYLENQKGGAGGSGGATITVEDDGSEVVTETSAVFVESPEESQLDPVVNEGRSKTRDIKAQPNKKKTFMGWVDDVQDDNISFVEKQNRVWEKKNNKDFKRWATTFALGYGLSVLASIIFPPAGLAILIFTGMLTSGIYTPKKRWDALGYLLYKNRQRVRKKRLKKNKWI